MVDTKRRARTRAPPVEAGFRRQTRARAAQPGASPLRAGIPDSGHPDGSFLPAQQQPSGVQLSRVRGAVTQPSRGQETRKQSLKSRSTRRQPARGRPSTPSPVQAASASIALDTIVVEVTDLHDPSRDIENEPSPGSRRKRGRHTNDEDAAESSSRKRPRRQVNSPAVVSPVSRSREVDSVQETRVEDEPTGVSGSVPGPNNIVTGADAQSSTLPEHVSQQAGLSLGDLETQPQRNLEETIASPRDAGFDFDILEDRQSQARSVSAETRNQARLPPASPEHPSRGPHSQHVTRSRSSTSAGFEIREDTRERQTPPRQEKHQIRAPFADIGPHLGGTLGELEDQAGVPLGDVGNPSRRSSSEFNIHQDTDVHPNRAPRHASPTRSTSSDFHVTLDENEPNPFESPPRRPLDGRDMRSGARQPLEEIEDYQRQSTGPGLSIYQDEGDHFEIFDDGENPAMRFDGELAPLIRQTLGEIHIQQRQTPRTDNQIALDENAQGPFHDGLVRLEETAPQLRQALQVVGAHQTRATGFHDSIDQNDQFSKWLRDSDGTLLAEIEAQPGQVHDDTDVLSTRTSSTDLNPSRNDNLASPFINQPRRPLGEFLTRPRPSLDGRNIRSSSSSNSSVDENQPRTQRGAQHLHSRQAQPLYGQSASQSLPQAQSDPPAQGEWGQVPLGEYRGAFAPQPQGFSDTPLRQGWGESRQQPRDPLREIGGEPAFSPVEYLSATSSGSSEFHVREDDENQHPAILDGLDTQSERTNRLIQQQVARQAMGERLGGAYRGEMGRETSMPSTAVPSPNLDHVEQENVHPRPVLTNSDAGSDDGDKENAIPAFDPYAPATQRGPSNDNEGSTQSTILVGTPVTVGPPPDTRGTNSASTIIQSIETPDSPTEITRRRRIRHPGQENMPPRASSSESRESGPVNRGPYYRGRLAMGLTPEAVVKSEPNSQASSDEVRIDFAPEENSLGSNRAENPIALESVGLDDNEEENAYPSRDEGTSSRLPRGETDYRYYEEIEGMI